MEGNMKAVHAVETYDPTAEIRQQNRDAIIHFDEGLVGFSECKDFVLMENPGLAPFRLLQSLESPHVGFLVLDPTILVNNYYDRIPRREWESVEVNGETKPLAFVIVVIGSTPETSTGNFQAPLLVNYDKMIGKQIILTDSEFSVRHPLV
jgi:flagellar assembly factor FliW